MTDDETTATFDVLVELGFEPIADPMPGLVFDFGNFELRACELTNLRFQQVVDFSGVLVTPRAVTSIEFEISPQVKSREQCIALIVYYLDNATGERVFQPAHQVDWVIEGRQQRHLVPWVSQRRTRAIVIHASCGVRREWARLAIKTLANYLRDVSDDTPVVFCFKDSVLTIRCNSKVVALAGIGEDWPTKYTITAGQLRQLPKRFMNDYVQVSIRDAKLRIGNQFYSGIVTSVL